MGKLLILGGTTEANRLAEAVAARGIPAIYSYAGRTASPKAPPLPHRVGGFGGPEGLAEFLRAEGISALVDATHPFAPTISRNALEAARAAGVPLLGHERAPWRPEPGEIWRDCADDSAAAEALAGPPRRVFLALGKSRLAAFAAQPQHEYLLRFVDPPESPPPFPRAEVVVGRGPFTLEGDRELLRSRRIEILVARNAGGEGAEAKLLAARELGIEILMIARPPALDRPSMADLAEVLEWIEAHVARLGV